MESSKGEKYYKSETLGSYDEWRSDPRFKEGDDMVFRAYAAVHGRESDVAKAEYARSLSENNTIVRIVSDVNGQIEAVWYVKKSEQNKYLKARSGAPRKSDFSVKERFAIYSQLVGVAKEVDLPLIVEPDMRFNALSSTLNSLGLSVVWNGEELERIMGDDYTRTHQQIGYDAYGQARFQVVNSLNRTFERRAYVLYPNGMVIPKTIVRVVAGREGWEIMGDVMGGVSRNNYFAMLQKDKITSQTKQGGLWEFPGGNVDPHEDMSHAAEREFDEETGINLKDLGVEVEEGGRFSYQFFHKDGKVYQPNTAVFKATFPSGRVEDEPGIKIKEGSEDRHQTGRWLLSGDILEGKIGLTRASNLMRLNLKNEEKLKIKENGSSDK